MFRSGIRRLTVLLVPAALACAPAEEAAAPVEGPNLVEVQATDFAFTMPDTVAAGITTFRMNTMEGPELHHFTLIRLGEGKTVADFTAALSGPPGPPPEWATFLGGPNAPVPGGHTDVTIDLAPGNYVAICLIPSADGVPHVAKGMMKAFTVVASEVVREMPPSDLTVTMVDYAFEWSAPPTAGSHLVKVVNAGTQWHEFEIIKLEPGKTAQDFLSWVATRDGPPPALPIGGVTPVGVGHDQYLALDLVPGDYAIICFAPDVNDGKEHFQHGMVGLFTVGQ